jgi:hypothetical protein
LGNTLEAERLDGFDCKLVNEVQMQRVHGNAGRRCSEVLRSAAGYSIAKTVDIDDTSSIYIKPAVIFASFHALPFD